MDRTALPTGEEQGNFDAELYAILRALGILGQRRETGVEYSIFSDLTAAIERVCAGQPGPVQGLVREITELKRLLIERGCSVTIWWALAHKGLEGNEVADSYAKWMAETHYNSVDRAYLRRQANPTSSKRRPRLAPSAPGTVSEAMSAAGVGTDHRRAVRSSRTYKER